MGFKGLREKVKEMKVVGEEGRDLRKFWKEMKQVLKKELQTFSKNVILR